MTSQTRLCNDQSIIIKAQHQHVAFGMLLPKTKNQKQTNHEHNGVRKHYLGSIHECKPPGKSAQARGNNGDLLCDLNPPILRGHKVCVFTCAPSPVTNGKTPTTRPHKIPIMNQSLEDRQGLVPWSNSHGPTYGSLWPTYSTARSLSCPPTLHHMLCMLLLPMLLISATSASFV